MAERLKIDFGFKEYEIADTFGNVLGVIRINPSDAGLATRWEDVQKNVKALADKAEKSVDGLRKADLEIKAQIDYAFGSEVSTVFFKNVSSLAMCENGHMVLENVLEALAPVVKAAQEAAGKKIQARVAGHAAPYQGSTAGLAPSQKA